MTAPNRSTLWARVLVDELGRHGLAHVCVGSGSRSAPLVEAFGRDDRFRVHPHVDERSAGFFALGISAASGVPAAVVTTSGTAAANLLPAVVEASQSDIPLIVLTADRPALLRGLDANQTIDQVRLYGQYPRSTIDLPLPRPRAADLRLLRASAARIWSAATGVAGRARGPVHVNVQFEKPLEPTVVPGDISPDLAEHEALGRSDGRPFTVLAGGASRGGAAAVGEHIARRLREARRPLIVCGPMVDEAVGAAVRACAARGSVPVLADPVSGARFGPGAAESVVAWADAILGSETAREALRPDLVVRVGPAPTSAAVNRFLEGLGDVDQLVVDGGERWKDHLGLATEYVSADPAAALSAALDVAAGRATASSGDPDSDCESDSGSAWRDLWWEASAAAGEVLGPLVGAGGDARFEGAVAAAAVRAVPDGGVLFVGNSMPIRDVDAFAVPVERPIRALGFRGASGIDGNVSGALGACAGTGRPTLALIGDLTLLHDVGALFSARSSSAGAEGVEAAAVQIIVIQNHGGGIFHMLPIREFDPPFTPHVVMPHDVDIGAVAGAAGIPHRLTTSIEELEAELEAGWASGGIRMVEVRTDREDNWARRRTALEAAADAVSERLAAGRPPPRTSGEPR